MACAGREGVCRQCCQQLCYDGWQAPAQSLQGVSHKHGRTGESEMAWCWEWMWRSSLIDAVPSRPPPTLQQVVSTATEPHSVSIQPDSWSPRWNIYRPHPALQSPKPASIFRCLALKPTRHCRSSRSPAPLPFRRTIRRQELRQIIPLSETTIYEMERRGEFPRRFNLTPRCVVWDLVEVEAWIEERKQAPRKEISKPDVRLRKTRPVRAGSDQE